MFTCGKPVSYTHLDVYKRQVTPDVLLAKGQTHYVCQLRANDYFASPEGQQFARLKQKIVEGCQDRRAFSPPIPANVWEKINIVRYSRRACLGCPFSSQCQYARLRDELKFTNGIIPVSYTHLDVYKRQRICRVPEAAS